MVDETQVPPFYEWFPWASLTWLVVAAALVLAAILLGLLVAICRSGPVTGTRRVRRTVLGGVADAICISPRRVWALAWLAAKESIRRRVVVGFAVFVLVLLFAGWFLDPGSTNPARLYLSFVLTATSYLVLILALFLSAFSLPTDIRARTLHTVVTKPVRPSEIVLGRILGFTIIGTALLVVMCVVSYVFVRRGLDHTHTLALEDLRPIGQVAGGQPGAQVGKTSRVHGHRHEVTISASGEGQVASERGHWHSLSVEGSGDQTTYRIGPQQGSLQARVPIYGKISFRDRGGVDKREGISVGDEWTYRSYIEGSTEAAVIWTFEGIAERKFPKELPVEMTIGVFRSHKGDIEKTIQGSLSLRNPKTGLIVEVEIFDSKEFTTNRLNVPRHIAKFSSADVVSRRAQSSQGIQLTPSAGEIERNKHLADKQAFDLFEDLVADGRIELWLRCLEPAQYFGAAQPDLYLRASDAWFWLNFVKGYFGIWLQMLLVVGFGVMFSTFLSGPVAMIATVGVLVGGFFRDFVVKLAFGETYGGGPAESWVRLVSGQNVVQELDPSFAGEVAQMGDRVLRLGLWVVSHVLPSFGEFSFADFVAYGFDVSSKEILVRSTTVLGFLVPLFVFGYFLLKIREVAK